MTPEEEQQRKRDNGLGSLSVVVSLCGSLFASCLPKNVKKMADDAPGQARKNAEANKK